MAYQKQTWRCGEVVTADKLNHMEDGIENATGFTCTEAVSTLTEEAVTTETSRDITAGTLTYEGLITADTIKVTFDGVEYTCQNEANANGGLYGDTSGDFTEYPFVLESNSIMDTTTGALIFQNIIYTKTAGTYDIIIEANALTVTETTECFVKAVNQVVEVPESKVIIGLSVTGASEGSQTTPQYSYPVAFNFGSPSFSDVYNNSRNTEYYVSFNGVLMRLTKINSSQAVFTAFEKVTVANATAGHRDQIRHYVFVWDANSTSYAVNTYDIEIPSAYN